MDTAKLKVVIVRWYDAIAHANWHIPDAELPLCITVGFLVEETDSAVEIASTVGEEMSECNASIVIPKGMIKSIRESDAEEETIH